MTQRMTGGCLCGRIRYSADIESTGAGMCHCRTCRHASGSFATAAVQVSPSAVNWDQQPDSYRSSPIAERLFCNRCGSPLGWRPLDGGMMDLPVGSFDDFEAFTPVAHGGAESMVEAWLETSSLPRFRTEDIPGMPERWRAAGAEVPD